MSRISLYKHELDVVFELTKAIIERHESPHVVAPMVLGQMLDAFYSRGHTARDSTPWRPVDFREVR